MSVVARKAALSVGALGESLAQEEYQKDGFEIIASNVFNHTGKQLGEIDFVAKNESKLVFVEVKTRTEGSDKYGGGAAAVGLSKQRRLLKAVKIFLANHRELNHLQPRIDVCVVILSKLDKQAKSVRIITNAVEDSH